MTVGQLLNTLARAVFPWYFLWREEEEATAARARANAANAAREVLSKYADAKTKEIAQLRADLYAATVARDEAVADRDAARRDRDALRDGVRGLLGEGN